MKKIFEYFLELILPQSDGLRKLETMRAEDLRRAAARSRAAALDDLPARTFVLFDYKQPLVREAIWELKYRGNKKVAKLLSECLYEEIAEELTDRKLSENFDRPILIPVPLSKKRLQKRGWNQCELLSDALHTIDNGNFFEVRKDILIKVRDTDSQTKKNRAARLENLKDCFAVPLPEKIAGRNIILLDDVTTTGATLEEARRTLVASGARKILTVAIAH